MVGRDVLNAVMQSVEHSAEVDMGEDAKSKTALRKAEEAKAGRVHSRPALQALKESLIDRLLQDAQSGLKVLS